MRAELARLAVKLHDHHGTTDGVSGMALGADQWWAASVLDAGMRLHAHVPFPQQPDKWPAEDRAEWEPRQSGRPIYDSASSPRGRSLNHAIAYCCRLVTCCEDAHRYRPLKHARPCTPRVRASAPSPKAFGYGSAPDDLITNPSTRRSMPESPEPDDLPDEVEHGDSDLGEQPEDVALLPSADYVPTPIHDAIHDFRNNAIKQAVWRAGQHFADAIHPGAGALVAATFVVIKALAAVETFNDSDGFFVSIPLELPHVPVGFAVRVREASGEFGATFDVDLMDHVYLEGVEKREPVALPRTEWPGEWITQYGMLGIWNHELVLAQKATVIHGAAGRTTFVGQPSATNSAALRVDSDSEELTVTFPAADVKKRSRTFGYLDVDDLATPQGWR